MNPISILMLGMAMSTDAFAAALARGAGMARTRLSDALKIGLIFGCIEAVTPVIGWLIGSVASELIEEYDHWVAFILLVGLGIHTIYAAVGEDGDRDMSENPGSNSLLSTALTGLATSIDAMAVGVGLAFTTVNIAVVAAVIGLCTFVMVTLGVLAGKVVGTVLGKRAEIAGGLILMIVGALILYEHLK
ncbi:manganese efflux pump [Corticibacter populi]|uniref:Putative manganese efflux pump MntP n=1 Tax=Corticibacter populi TaxID=1550736 RepID=A0A3M6QY15_9BURK|nr:manganese efflux pump MntP family protein [Corticibacter populi]RMX07763.1 manganese efflux pump [Corticibacter populi]RZS34985.1 putative Mn2+ efflux pump MntP [Corticibacter populi]